MKPGTKKLIIVGILGTISIALAAAYLQYRKMMNYTIKFKGVRIKTLSLKLFDFDMSIGFFNKSNLKFIINSQSYKVYINDKLATTLVNNLPITINKESESLITLNVKLAPKDLMNIIGAEAGNIITAPDKVKIKIDMKLSVKMWGLPINIPYVYESTLKQMTEKKPES